MTLCRGDIMSEDNYGASDMEVCSSCGVAEVDDIKLKECDDCDLVRYCGDQCQKNHRQQHEEACKKRAAELRDELLFKQPESTHRGDCPICMLPMPLAAETMSYNCCSVLVCYGCDLAQSMSEMNTSSSMKTSKLSVCPFCREAVPKTKVEWDKQRMKRVDANDPFAMREEGIKQQIDGDYQSALKYFLKAADLGDAEAHHRVADFYYDGKGVEKNMGKVMYHTKAASIGGHPIARHFLAILEQGNGNTEIAVKHWIIAAAQGFDLSIKVLMDEFRNGLVSKDDLATALRAHHAAVDAMKSPQRGVADDFRQYRKDLEEGM